MSNTEKKITKRENYAFLRNLIETSSLDTETMDRMLTFVDHEVELLDKRVASSKKSAKKNEAATDVLSGAVLDVLATNSDKSFTIPEIVAAIDETLAPTAQKVTYRLTKLAENDRVYKDSVSIKEEGKASRKVNAYRIVEIQPTEDPSEE